MEYTESLSIFNITVNVDEKVDDPYRPLCYHAEAGLTKEQWHVLASPLQVLAMDRPSDHHTVYPRFQDELLHCRGGAFVYDDEEHSPGLVERAKRHILDAVAGRCSRSARNCRSARSKSQSNWTRRGIGAAPARAR